MQKRAIPNKDDRIAIVGAGVFGLSTAKRLSELGYRNVVVFDRSVPPVIDGTSNDVSRIVRPDYADPVYTEIAMEALEHWKRSHHFYPSGFINMSKSDNAYKTQSQSNLETLGISVKSVDRLADAKSVYANIRGTMDGECGYINQSAGWANPAGAMKELTGICVDMGISIVSGPKGTVSEVCVHDQEVQHLRMQSGDVEEACLFVIAAGAWTAGLVDLSALLLATAQPVGFAKLTSEEQAQLVGLPVYINLQTGFYVFPPSDDGYIKCARHGYGYTRSVTKDGKTFSCPPTALTRPPYILPDDALDTFRDGLRSFYGHAIASRPIERQKLCWYTETANGDFIMDYDKRYRNLFIATGGSGHGFKFLPVLGKYIVSAVMQDLDPALQDKWSINKEAISTSIKSDGSRGGPERRELPVQCISRDSQIE